MASRMLAPCVQASSFRRVGQAPKQASRRAAHRARPRGRGVAGRRCTGQRGQLVVRAGPVEIDEEDLLQYPDRVKWYEAKFCAEDMPEWNAARFVRRELLCADVACVTLEIEASRERIPIKAAYKCVGQRACVRINGGAEEQALACSAPFPLSVNKEPLFYVRGDLFAGDTKTVRELTSALAELQLYVRREECPELFAMGDDDDVEVGPFAGTGLDMRSSEIMAVYRYPTVVIFVAGDGIAAARALVNSGCDVPSLSATFRKDVCLYYQVTNEMSTCFKAELDTWAALGVRVMRSSSSFQDMFDDDDTLTYDPEATAAVILTGGDEEAEAAAREVCREAEISLVVSDAVEQPPHVHMDSTPTSFSRWKNRGGVAPAAAAAEGANATSA